MICKYRVRKMEATFCRNLFNKVYFWTNGYYWLLKLVTTTMTYTYAVKSNHVFWPQMVYHKRKPRIDGLYLNLLQLQLHLQLLQCCTQLYSNVFTYTVMYSPVRRCTQLYSDVLNCLVLYWTVQWCTKLYSDVLTCTMMYSHVKWCTHLYSDLLTCSVMYST